MDREKISEEEQKEFEDMLKLHQEEWNKLWKKELKHGKILFRINIILIIFIVINIINNISNNNWFGMSCMIFVLVINIVSAKNMYKNYNIIQKKYLKK